MSTWNLQNDGNSNAGEIQGYPVDIPPVLNNEVLIFDSLTQSFVAGNVSSAGGLTGANGVGNITPVYGINAGILELKGIEGDGTNISTSNINSDTQIQVSLNPDVTVTTLTVTDKVKNILLVESTTPGLTAINSSCNPSAGSISILGCGDNAAQKGFALIYSRDSDSAILAGNGAVTPPAGTFTIANTVNDLILTSGTKIELDCNTGTGPLEVLSSNFTTSSSGTVIDVPTVINADLSVESTHKIVCNNFQAHGTGTINVNSDVIFNNDIKPSEVIDSVNAGGAGGQYIGSNGSGGIVWKLVDIDEIVGFDINTPVNGEYMKYNGSDWVNSTVPSVYNNFLSVYSSGTINVGTDSTFYLDYSGATYNVAATPPVGTRFGWRIGANPTTINLNNPLYTNDGYYINPVTINGGQDGTVIEIGFTNNNSNTAWAITNFSGVAFINGVQTCTVENLDDIKNVHIAGPTNGQYLGYSSGLWTNQTIPAADVTIYSGDAIVLGNRTIDCGTYFMKFEDASDFILNITGINSQTTNTQNYMLTSNTSGSVQAYALSHTKNSVTFDANIQNLSGLDNIIDIYETDMVANACFSADVWLSLQGSNSSNSCKWEICNFIGGGDTGWQNFPFAYNNFEAGVTSNVYILQGRIGQSSNNVLQLRLVKIYGSTNPVQPAKIKIVRRDNDVGTFTLPAQTPYNEITINYQLPLQNFQKNRVYNWNGGNITGFGTQQFYYTPGMNLLLSSTVTFDLDTTGASNTVACVFFINGNAIPALSAPNLFQTANNVVLHKACISWSDQDCEPMNLIQLGYLNPGINSITLSFTTSGGTLSTTDCWYSISMKMFF